MGKLLILLKLVPANKCVLKVHRIMAKKISLENTLPATIIFVHNCNRLYRALEFNFMRINVCLCVCLGEGAADVS